MEVIFILIPVSLMIVFSSIFIFLWAVNNYQFDDLDKEAERILRDEPGQPGDSRSNSQSTSQIVSQKPGGSV